MGGFASLGINLPLLLAFVINFIILLVLLGKFLYKPVLKMLDERTQKVKESMEWAESIKRDYEQAKVEVQKQIEKGRQEAQAIIAQAVQKGEALKEEARKEASGQAKAIVEKARAELEAERDKMVEDLRKEFVSLLILASEKVIRQTLDKEKQSRLIEETLEADQTFFKKLEQPMAKRVSGKWYGQAIFELALEKKALESCQKGLDQLAELTRDESLMALCENPKLPFEAKERLLKEGLGEVHPFVLNLALLLVSKDNLRLAGDISRQYRLLFDAYRGIEHAELTTAVPLDEKEKEVLSRRMGEILGRKVTFDLQVDPSIIGGFIARIGDMLIDGSVRQNLDSLGKSLLEAGRS